MRRINVGYFDRAKFLATQSCVISERKHQPRACNLRLQDGKHAAPFSLTRNPWQRVVARDEAALPPRTKCFTRSIPASPHWVFRAKPFFHQEIVKEPDHCQ